jgi:THO complex subunit 4
MSMKLDQPLDDIVKTQRQTRRRRGAGPRGQRKPAQASKGAPAAPSGGIKKNTRNTTAPKSNVVAALQVPSGDGKILVSNLVRSILSQF